MFTWFKNLNAVRIKLLYIAKHYDSIAASVGELQVSQIRIENHVNDAVRTIRDRTTWHADVKSYPNGEPHQVIMVGNYRGKDYVEIFNVSAEDFRGLVMQCKDITKFSRRGRIDAAPEMKFILDKETEWWWDK